MASQNRQRAFEDANNRALYEGLCVADIVKVIAFDAEKMTVDVQPLVKYPDADTYQTKPQVLRVPVSMIYGGGFVVRPIYEKGDIGVVVYLDRDSDAALAGGTESMPSSQRLHSGDDAVFIGGIRAGANTISGLPDGSLCMGTDTGSAYVSIGESSIEIGGDVTFTGNVTVNGSLKVNGTIFDSAGSVVTGG